MLDCVWNVTPHAQKPDFVFWRNGRVRLNRQGRQFSRLLAAEVCASAVVMVVMLDTPCSEVVWRALATYSIRQFPLPCMTVCHHISTGVYLKCRASNTRSVQLFQSLVLAYWHHTPTADSMIHVTQHRARRLYSRIPLIRINWDGQSSGYAEIPDNWIFLWKYVTMAVWSVKKISTNSCFRLRIYLRTNKTLIHNSLYVFDNWGRGNLSHKKMQYNYSNKTFTGRAELIWIIGGPGKWSSTALTANGRVTRAI
jgi:hypothetical protein